MSLYETLTGLSNPFPATDVIKSLLCILSNELCASNLQRNSHTFCTLISRSRDICNHINSLIEKSITEDGWTSYDQYTAMIEPLEALLLSVSDVTNTSRVETLTNTVHIDEWIVGAQSWNIDRKKVKDTLTSAFSKDVFQSVPSTLTSEDTKYSWKHDGDVFLDSLIRGLERRLSNNKARSAAGIQPRFTSIQSKLRDIQTKAKDSTSDEIIVIAIKSTILVNGVVEVTINTTVPETRAHLGSTTVLSKTQELLDSIFQSFSQPHIADLEKKYSDFETLLRTIKQEAYPSIVPPPSRPTRRAPGSFLDLQKFPGDIRPPYYLQTLVLVQYCHALVNRYLKAESELSRKPMDDAISATTIALRGAANLRDKASNRTTIDFENMQSSEVTNAYKSAITTIEFDASRMDTAKENDAKRLKAWKDRVKDRDMNKPLNHVEIVVKFKDEAAPRSAVNSREQKISVPPTTQLDVILWEVLAHTSPEIRDRVRSRSHFKTESSSETLSLSDPASKVAGRVLLLVIGA